MAGDSRRTRAKSPGRVRIVGGIWRSRRIAVPARNEVRPTPDRVRETLFNWLGQNLTGLACLDLFAGSGALGFEAASRGAARVVMVENDRETLAILDQTRTALEARQIEIIAADAIGFLARSAAPFDVVFLDPPFRQNAWSEILRLLPRNLAPGARVYVESGTRPEFGSPWRELKRGRAGQVNYQLLTWEGDDRSGVSGDV